MKISLSLATLLIVLPVLTGRAQETNESAPAGSLTVTSQGLQMDSPSDQERIDLLMEVATVYFSEEEYESAISAYERILEIDPKHREAHFIIGHVYITARQYGKAEAILKALVEEYPDDFHLKNNLAWLYATAEDPAYRDGNKAILLAQEAMVLSPYDHHVWSTLAEAYYVTGQYEKAYRAITHMASLATRYGTNITQDMVNSYNEQILRCRRAWETEKALQEEEMDDPENAAE